MVVVCGHCLVTLSLKINETLTWLSSLPILMQGSFWWWQFSDRYIISPPPFPPFSPSLISLVVSVDVKHHVYLLLERQLATEDDDDVELNVLGCRIDILGTNCDQCVSTVQCCFTSTETIRLIRTGSPGLPPRLSHSSWRGDRKVMNGLLLGVRNTHNSTPTSTRP